MPAEESTTAGDEGERMKPMTRLGSEPAHTRSDAQQQRRRGGAPVTLLASVALATFGAIGAAVRAFFHNRSAKSKSALASQALVQRGRVPGARSPSPPATPLPLDGRAFAVSEEVALASLPPTAGTSLVPAADGTSCSFAAELALKCGASCVGKAHVASLLSCVGSYSLKNPLSDNRTPRATGGSANGSAIAVALGECSFALAADCRGDARLPAVTCGVFGMRLSCNALPLDGFLIACESLQSVGIIALDPSILLTTVQAMLQPPSSAAAAVSTPSSGSVSSSSFTTAPPNRYISATDAVALCDDAVKQSTAALAEACGSPAATVSLGERLLAKCDTLKQFSDNDGLEACQQVLDTIFAKEAYMRFKKHIDGQNLEHLESEAQQTMSAGAKVTQKSYRKALQAQEEVRDVMEDMLSGDSVLILPASPSQPPSAKSIADVATWASNSKKMLAPASLAGQPHVNLSDGSGKGTGMALVASKFHDIQLAMATVKVAYSAQQKAVGTASALQANESGRSKPAATNADGSSLSGAKQTTAGKAAAAQEPSEAEKLKAKGNECVKNGNHHDAVQQYTQALNKCGGGEEDAKTKAVVLSNRAQASIKLGKHTEAEADCDEALKLDSKFVKAYFRRGCARNALGKQQEALDDFKEAKRLEPSNRQAATELARIEANLQQQQQHEQQSEGASEGTSGSS